MKGMFLGKPLHWLLWAAIVAVLYLLGSLRLHHARLQPLRGHRPGAGRGGRARHRPDLQEGRIPPITLVRFSGITSLMSGVVLNNTPPAAPPWQCSN